MGNLFYNAVNMSVTGAVMIGAVMLLRLAFRKLPRRYSYALWIIPAVRLLCPVAMSSAISIFNLFGTPVNENRMEYISSPVETEVYSQTASVSQAPHISDNSQSDNSAGESETPVVNENYEHDNVSVINETPSAVNEETAPDNSENTDSGFESAANIAAIIWLCGSMGVLIWTAVSWETVRRRIKNAENAGEMYICDNIETPFVFGIIRPKIYVPRGISEDDLRCVLAHERAHISRGDHIVKLLCIPITAIHWFNPLVWVGCRLMTDDMELSCDERALSALGNEERKTYANALLNMSMRQSKLSLGGALSFGESGIKGRIKGILGAKTPTKAAVVAAAVIIVGASVCLLTNAQNSDFIRLGSYESINLISADGVRECARSEIKEFVDVFDSISFKRVGAPSEAPENFLFSLIFYKGSMAAADPDSVRFFIHENEDGSEEIYAQLRQNLLANTKYSYFTVTDEEFERAYSSFSEYASHSFTGTVTGTAENEYTLVPDPLGGKPNIYFDFSDSHYTVSLDNLNGVTDSVTVSSEEEFQPGDRVRVSYYGNDMSDNVTVEKAKTTKCYIGVRNDITNASYGTDDEDSKKIWQRLTNMELTPADKSELFIGIDEEYALASGYNTFYTVQANDGEHFIRIACLSPATDAMEFAEVRKPHRYIAVQKGYMDFCGVPVYYTISDSDWEYLCKDVCGKYDEPFLPGIYKRINRGDNIEAEIEIDPNGNIRIHKTDEQLAEVEEFYTASEQAYGYKLLRDQHMQYLEYKGAGVIAYSQSLISSYMDTAYGIYVREEKSAESLKSEKPIKYTEHTVVMPDNDIRSNEITKQMPAVYLSLDLPEGWTVNTPKRNEETYLPELFTPVNIYDTRGEFAGTAALGFFEESVDIDDGDAHLTVYKDLQGNWQESYTPVSHEYFSQNAFTKIDGSYAAMYFDEFDGVFAVARFKEGAVTEEQCREVAKSIIIYEYYSEPRDIMESFVRYYYSGLGSGYFHPEMFTDNPQMREYLNLKLTYERSLDLDVGGNGIWFHADTDYFGRKENQYGEEVRFYSLGFNVTSEYSRLGGGGDFELVKKDGGWRIHRGVIYTIGDEMALGFDFTNRLRPPVEYDLNAGIEKLKTAIAGDGSADNSQTVPVIGQNSPTPEEAVREYLAGMNITTTAGVFEDEPETEKYRQSNVNADNLTAVIAASHDFDDSYARYYIVEGTPESGYRVRDDLTYATENSVFVAQVTEITAAGDVYIVKPYKGQPEGGRDSDDYRPEIFVTCDFDLKLGESIVVCYPGEMTASAPAQIVQLWERRYTGSDFPTYARVEEESNSNISYVELMRVMPVGNKDEYGGVSYSNNDDYVEVVMDIPDYYKISGDDVLVNGLVNEKKVVSMGALWPAEQGFSPEDMKIDMVSGRTITVYEEETGSSGLYEYMLHSSLPDHYSESGVYDTYKYIVRRGDYMICIYFLAEFYDKDIAEHMLNSLEIAFLDPDSVYYSDIEMGVFYNSESGIAEGYIFNGSEYEVAVMQSRVLTRLNDEGEYVAPQYIGNIYAAPTPAEIVFIAPGDVYIFSENFGENYRMIPGEYRFENTCWYTIICGESYIPRFSGQLTGYFTVEEES